MQQTQRHHYKPLLEIGVPIVIGQLGTIILGFADTLMIGHHSTIELGAAGLVNNIFTLGLLFYLGFSYGLTPIVGRLFGMGRTDEIGQKVKNSIVANMVVGLLLMAMMTLLYLNLHNIGQPEELLPIIRPYFLVNLVSIPFVGMFNTLKQFFDGITRTQVPMWVILHRQRLCPLPPEPEAEHRDACRLCRDEPSGLARGAAVGHRVGCLHAELRDGGLAGHHSTGVSPDNDYHLPVVLPGAIGHGLSHIHPHQLLHGAEGV